jgi:hypothetical protein
VDTAPEGGRGGRGQWSLWPLHPSLLGAGAVGRPLRSPAQPSLTRRPERRPARWSKRSTTCPFPRLGCGLMSARSCCARRLRPSSIVGSSASRRFDWCRSRAARRDPRLRDLGPERAALPRSADGRRRRIATVSPMQRAPIDGVTAEHDPSACTRLSGSAGHLPSRWSDDLRNLHPSPHCKGPDDPCCCADRGLRHGDRPQRQQPSAAKRNTLEAIANPTGSRVCATTSSAAAGPDGAGTPRTASALGSRPTSKKPSARSAS